MEAGLADVRDRSDCEVATEATHGILHHDHAAEDDGTLGSVLQRLCHDLGPDTGRVAHSDGEWEVLVHGDTCCPARTGPLSFAIAEWAFHGLIMPQSPDLESDTF